jgi:hypothetical protein
MIKFFRKIRQKMLTENKFSKYLIYAIGEIILVVFGILIALQINTWNKEIQNRALERKSLENLIADLVIQKEIILEQQDNEILKLTEIDTCSFFFSSALPIVELYRLLLSLTSRHTFIANKATFDNMGSTGDIVLISDPDLQNAIVRYYKQLDYTASVINNNNLFLIDNQFGNFVFNNVLGFRLNEDGMMDTGYIMAPEQRFTLKTQLRGRQKASQSIQLKCNLQLEATEKLIQLIKEH